MKSARMIVAALSLLCALVLAIKPAFADDASSLGIATYLPIQGDNIKNGDLVSYANNGYILAHNSYDPLVVGVVTLKPAVAIVDNKKGSYAVVSSGNALVNVTSANGPIKVGDLITSSSIPGVGVKATHSGYVIGAALEEYADSDSKKVGQIAISLNVHYFSNKVSIGSNLLDIFNLSTTATYESPTIVFKYFIASLVVVLSFVFGFIFFGRTANKGLEALGRNPLASGVIQTGIFLNVVITVAIIAAGIAVAYFVIRL